MKIADVGPQLDFVRPQTRSGSRTALRTPSALLVILMASGLAFWGYHLLTPKKSATVMVDQRASTSPAKNSSNVTEPVAVVASTDTAIPATASATAEIKTPDQPAAWGKHIGDSTDGAVISEKLPARVANGGESKSKNDKNTIEINSLPKHSLSSTRASIAAIKSSPKKLASKPKAVAAFSSVKKSAHRVKIALATRHKKKAVSHAEVALAAAYVRKPNNYAKTTPVRQADSQEWQHQSGQQAEIGQQIAVPDVILKNKRNVRLTIGTSE